MSPWMWVALPAAAQSNYLVIIADDLGTDKISAYYPDVPTYTGAHRPTTPEIDALASEGARFTRAWANPSCSPTRASLQTGEYAFRHGIGKALDDGEPGLDPDLWPDQLLGELFAPTYATGYFGKWHVGTEDAAGDTGLPPVGALTAEPHPVRLGYERFHGTTTGEMSPDYFDWPLLDWVAGAGTFDDAPGVHSLIDTTDAASAWIDSVAAEPWLAVVAYHAPHAPAQVAPNNDGWTLADLPVECVITEPCLLTDTCASTPGGMNDEEDLAVYRTLVECMDTQIGRLLDEIGHHELEDTIVVFMGDNGTPDDVQEGVFLANGGKGTVKEGGIRVPLIVADGGVRFGEVAPDVTAGLVVSDPVLTLDLHATLLDLAGIAVTPTTDARSLAPCLDDGSCDWGTRFVYTEKFDPADATSGIGAIGYGGDKMTVEIGATGCLSPTYYWVSGTSLDFLPVLPWTTTRKDRLKNQFTALHVGGDWASGRKFCK